MNKSQELPQVPAVSNLFCKTFRIPDHLQKVDLIDEIHFRLRWVRSLCDVLIDMKEGSISEDVRSVVSLSYEQIRQMELLMEFLWEEYHSDHEDR